MSGKKQLGPAKQAAADKKKLNSLMRRMADEPEEFDFGGLPVEHRKKLLTIVQEDLREATTAYNSLSVLLMHNAAQKTLALRKGDNVLIEFAWDPADLKNQFVTLNKMKEYFSENREKMKTMDTPIHKAYREVTEMIGNLPDEYIPGSERLDLYLDQFNDIHHDAFCDIVCFHKMKMAERDGTITRARSKNETKKQYMEAAHEHFKSFAEVMHSDTISLLADRIEFRRNQERMG